MFKASQCTEYAELTALISATPRNLPTMCPRSRPPNIDGWMFRKLRFDKRKEIGPSWG